MLTVYACVHAYACAYACSNRSKLLGITFGLTLSFDVHVSNHCKEANQKLNALAGISCSISISKLKLMMNAFITLAIPL